MEENKYDLELNIMACLLLKPELMEGVKTEKGEYKIIVKDDDFKKHKKMWRFLNAVYEKFGTFDINLIYSVCREKYKVAQYLETLVLMEPTPCNFMKYQERLIEQNKEEKETVELIDEILRNTNHLETRSITLEAYKNKMNKIFEKVKNTDE